MTEAVAVIDVGSNSIKLLVACPKGASNSLETLHIKTIESRISEGIDSKSPYLSDAAIERGSRAIIDLYHVAKEYKAKQISIVATSAVRDAKNSNVLQKKISKATGLKIRILSGIEEATYIGHGLLYDPDLRDLNSFIQIDIGGGSMELIRFEYGDIKKAISLPLGAVRLTERFLLSDNNQFTFEAESSLRAHVREELKKSKFTFSPEALPLVATGGAFTVSRAIIASKQGNLIENSSPDLNRENLNALKEELAVLTLEERLRIPGLPQGRADILPTALITIDALLDFGGHCSLKHSFYNLRYGIAAKLLFSLD